MQTLISNLDSSVNFIEEKLQGFIESRYVRRTDDYFIAYLSSQTGCNRGCKFCHLTITKQTKFDNLSVAAIVASTDHIFYEYANSNNIAKKVHFNFMARGEPLCNPNITDSRSDLFLRLGHKALDKNLIPKFNISTIIPKDIKLSLAEMFPLYTPTIYYSIYSINDDFRSKWMPNALPLHEALSQLKEYQNNSKKIVKFHSAFIAGENDNPRDIVDMMELIKDYNITAQFNIVRYNPYSAEQGAESLQLQSIARIIKNYMPCKLITRVGEDVKASCGMFVEKSS